MKTVIICGAGTSMINGIALGLWDKIKNKEIWSLNSIFKIMPYLPARELWMDISFFKHEMNNLQELQAQGVLLVTRNCARWNKYPGIKLYEVTNEKNKANTNVFYRGASGLTGYFALNVAIKEGYDKIYLIGYDGGGKDVNDEHTHCYQFTHSLVKDLNQTKDPKTEIYSHGAGNSNVYFHPNGKFLPAITDFADFIPYKNKIWNVSLSSNIEYFPKISYITFFSEIEEIKSNE